MQKTIPTYDLELELRNKGCKYIIGVDEAGRGCEHPRAEGLTDNGWKHYSDITLTDMVLSYTSNGEIGWQNIEAVVEKDFSGYLIELKNAGIHIYVTPDHYFDVVRRVFKRDDNYKLRLVGYKFRGRKCVEDLVANDYIPRGGRWVGQMKDFFILPSINKSEHDNSGKDYSEKHIEMGIWASFMGIYLSEGSCSCCGGGYNVTISQSKKSIYYNEIKYLLNMMPFSFNETSVGFTVYNKQLYVYLKQFGDKYSKFIPKDIKELSPCFLKLFIEWAIKGDGSCYTGYNRQEICTYYTVSKRLKDDFEEVILKAGRTYHTTCRDPKDKFIQGRLVKKENQKRCFEIRLRRNNKASVKHLHKDYIPYNGKVFCLSLPEHHNFYVRRSGTGYFTGNSLMGPVVAAAVHIPEGFDTAGIDDSKKLSSKNRELFYNKIIEKCDYAFYAIDNGTIDSINILEATMMCMRYSIMSITKADYALIDGNRLPEFLGVSAECVVGGDGKSVSIAAASIVAKVTRDKMVLEMHEQYPIYGWDKNKGYGTQEHRDAIKLYGATPYHRKSFSGVKEYV